MFAMGIEVHQGPRASDLFEKAKPLLWAELRLRVMPKPSSKVYVLILII